MPNSSDPTLVEYIARFKNGTELTHEFTRGDATADVHGTDGTYPSLAKIAATAAEQITALYTTAITNVGNDDMVFGQAVYLHDYLNGGLANASLAIKKTVAGLVSDKVIISQSGTGRITHAGKLTGTVEEWVVATGMVGGLLPNTDYFLDVVSGRITPFPSTTSGHFICPVGRALSSTVFSIRIDRTVAL